MPVQISCKSNTDPVKTKKVMLRTMSNMVFFGTQGRVTPKSIVRPGSNSNSSEMLWLSWLSASSKMIRSKVEAVSSGQHFLHDKSMGKFFVAQGRVTPKWINRSVPKSNSCEIVSLSLLPASLMKIWSKINSLSFGQHFPYYMSMGAFGSRGN